MELAAKRFRDVEMDDLSAIRNLERVHGIKWSEEETGAEDKGQSCSEAEVRKS